MNMNITTNLVVLDLTAACNGLTVNGVTMGYSGAPTPDVEIVLREIVSWVSSVGNCFIPYLTGLKYDGKIVVIEIVSSQSVKLSGAAREMVRDGAGKIVLLGHRA